MKHLLVALSDRDECRYHNCVCTPEIVRKATCHEYNINRKN